MEYSSLESRVENVAMEQQDDMNLGLVVNDRSVLVIYLVIIIIIIILFISACMENMNNWIERRIVIAVLVMCFLILIIAVHVFLNVCGEMKT